MISNKVLMFFFVLAESRRISIIQTYEYVVYDEKAIRSLLWFLTIK